MTKIKIKSSLHVKSLTFGDICHWSLGSYSSLLCTYLGGATRLDEHIAFSGSPSLCFILCYCFSIYIAFCTVG